ncbi:tRNA (adenine(37)-N6)-methyltransferase [hydrothermal vent metagenome]|uniref:tRNA (Adenine(37)-N6)-methyltransferase n=1 Tax=hydrothermal vent metagenome TaxID=652676 RepID=A0A3B1BDN0_9ZZZZ
MNYSFNPIGIVHSPFREKFGIPRQPGLVPDARARLELLAPYDQLESVTSLETFSHIWLTFVFHDALRDRWQPTVRPPRLGGNRRVGVFASRSPFRPNPVGLSVVALDGISNEGGKLALQISGIDILDGTPVLDIKPYIPYVDSIPEAIGGYAGKSPEISMQVQFSQQVEGQLMQREEGVELRQLIVQLLELDPRPAYKERVQQERVYGMKLYDFDLRWRVRGDVIEVVELGSTLT